MPSLKDMRAQAKEAGLMKLDKLIATRHSWGRQGDTISEIIDKGGYF